MCLPRCSNGWINTSKKGTDIKFWMDSFKDKIFLTLIVFLFILICFDQLQAGNQKNNVEYNFRVINHNLHFEINPIKKLFKSKQTIIIKNDSPKSVKEVFFTIHPELIITKLTLKGSTDNQAYPISWKSCGSEKVFGNFEFKVINVETERFIMPGDEISLYIEYHLTPEAVSNEPKEMYALTISPKASYSIYIGCNPLFGLNMAYPFRMAIKYPAGYYSCVPGNMISSKEEDEFITDTYVSSTPNMPTFSCAQYKKTEKKNENIKVEYYLYPEEEFNDEMAKNTFEVVKLFYDYFGDNGTKVYKFATVGETGSQNLSGENKANTMYFTSYATKNFNAGSDGRLDYLRLVTHEVYHNWNLFYVYWDGILREWFGEGGANFISAWAVEKILGEDAGKRVRRLYLQRFINGEAYKSSLTLENAQKIGSAENSLIYNGGALVWEQLRMKIGDRDLFLGLKDFYKKYGLKNTGYKAFLDCIQARTDINVQEYLNQWIKIVPKIDLLIEDVKTEKNKNVYESKVDLILNANRDYEIFTDVGYKTSSNGKMIIKKLKISGIGKITTIIKSKEKPVFIQVDPYSRVPQENIDNDIWRIQ
ncbi:MAG: hypothetical protein GTN73_09115 [Candidatus Aminicenantes bacterium]|nr:hypothetical protein [Candidatus Aminicenantes bacterium]